MNVPRSIRYWAWLVGLVVVCGIGAPAQALLNPDGTAAVNTPAPAFTGYDVDDKKWTLEKLRGTYVVLEWLNPECPFVKKHYGSGNMQTLQQRYTGRGVVWLSVDSSAAGKQGHLTTAQARTYAKEQRSAATAILLDAPGVVGRAYDATTTPHMFVIDPKGTLIYQGAIDDRPSADPADVAGATNYVAQALEESMAGKPVSVPNTRSYGCSVKYAR
jgi:peroxiredoxin